MKQGAKHLINGCEAPTRNYARSASEEAQRGFAPRSGGSLRAAPSFQLKKLNIGIIAHVDAGKTTLTENILFLGGAIKQAGRVDKGDTRTDSMAVERRRGISVRAAATSFFHGEVKFNLIDTPGHVDFVAEVERSLTVLDGVVLVISAKEGLQSQTRILMDTIKARKIPTVIFINKIDRMGADIAQVVESANKYMDGRLVSTQVITHNGNIQPLSPDELSQTAIETLCNHDEGLLEKYVDNREITPADFMHSFTNLSSTGQLYPVFYGSALHAIGVENLLTNLPHYLPTADANSDAPLSAVVFKVDNSGEKRLVYARLFSGTLATRDPGAEIKLTRLGGLSNGKIIDTNLVEAGDIAVLYHTNLAVGDILGQLPPASKRVKLGSPTLNVEVVPENPEERRALYNALTSLADEDPLLGLNTENTFSVRLFGEVQMEILREILAERYGIAAEFAAARTIYAEAPTQAASAVIGFGKTFFSAGVGFSVEPLPRGSGIVYETAVSYGELTSGFQVAVEEAVMEACQRGLMGWEITDMRVVFDFSQYDSVSSTPAAFRNLVPLVLMQALKEAEMVLLEPILEFELRVPESAISKAMYDMQMLNASDYDATAMPDGTMLITGLVPSDTARGYGAKVGSYTEGRGSFMTKFHGYKETAHVDEKVNHDRINPATNAGLYVLAKLGAR